MVDTTALLENIDLASFIHSSGVKLKKNGASFVGLCPFHNEKTPSFKVRYNRFKCFGCGESGDAISFVMKYLGKTFLEACEYLSTGCIKHKTPNKVVIPKNINKEVESISNEMLKDMMKGTHEYMKYKGFKEEECYILHDKLLKEYWRRLKLLQNEDFYWKDLDQYALCFPMRTIENKLVGWQTIRLINNEWVKRMIPGMKSNGAVRFMGPRWNSDYFLCEGWATGLSIKNALKKIEFDSTVVVCFSAYNIVEVAKLLKNNIYIMADHDDTGIKCAQATGKKWIAPEKYKDDFNNVKSVYDIIDAINKVRNGM